MKCTYCGNELSLEARFCTRCGKAVDTGVTQQGANVSDNINRRNNSQSNQSVPKKSSKKGIIAVLIVVIALIGFVIAGIIGFLGYYVFFKDSSAPTVQYDDTNDSYVDTIEIDTEYEEPETEDEDDDYFFPSDREYITERDLRGKTKEEVAFIRNEIYARHGYVFNTEPYKSYFAQKDWYTPNPNFNDDMFNEIEEKNKDFIVDYETEKGWR